MAPNPFGLLACGIKSDQIQLISLRPSSCVFLRPSATTPLPSASRGSPPGSHLLLEGLPGQQRGRNGCDNELRMGLGDTDQSMERSQAESIAEFACAVHFRPGSEMYCWPMCWPQANRSANRCLRRGLGLGNGKIENGPRSQIW